MMTLSTSEAHTLTRELQQRSKCYTVQVLCHDLAPTGDGGVDQSGLFTYCLSRAKFLK